MIDDGDIGHVVIKNKPNPENLDSIPTTTPPQEAPTSPPQELPTAQTAVKFTEVPAPTPTIHFASDEIVDENESKFDSGDASIEIDDKSTGSNITKGNETLSPTKPIIEEETQNTTKSTNTSSYEETILDGIPSTLPPSYMPTKKPTLTATKEIANHIREPLSDSDLSPVAKLFAETHCDLTQVKDGAWYPSSPEDKWQQRAPYLIFAGVWNAGVGPVSRALLKHPQISSAKMEGFFLPKQFSKYLLVQTNDKSPIASNQTKTFSVKVFAARERMYAQVYSKTIFQEKIDDESEALETTEVQNQKIAVDVSPGLMFYAQKTAHSILCTAPWAKVVVLLRNPIDRLYSQWAYSVQTLNLKLSLEDWMAQEMKLLQSVGLIGGGDEETQPNEKFLSEREAWERYQSVRKVAGALGRSLYVFQLEEWIQAYISAGKNPSEEIIILTTEDIEEDPGNQYLELLQFLGLAPFEDAHSEGSAASKLGDELKQASDLEPMTPETRAMLKNFFKPYNKRLTDLLTSNGFEGNWDKRWE